MAGHLKPRHGQAVAFQGTVRTDLWQALHNRTRHNVKVEPQHKPIRTHRSKAFRLDRDDPIGIGIGIGNGTGNGTGTGIGIGIGIGIGVGIGIGIGIGIAGLFVVVVVVVVVVMVCPLVFPIVRGLLIVDC